MRTDRIDQSRAVADASARRSVPVPKHGEAAIGRARVIADRGMISAATMEEMPEHRQYLAAEQRVRVLTCFLAPRRSQATCSVILARGEKVYHLAETSRLPIFLPAVRSSFDPVGLDRRPGKARLVAWAIPMSKRRRKKTVRSIVSCWRATGSRSASISSCWRPWRRLAAGQLRPRRRYERRSSSLRHATDASARETESPCPDTAAPAGERDLL
jgi:hypothetical protein